MKSIIPGVNEVIASFAQYREELLKALDIVRMRTKPEWLWNHQVKIFLEAVASEAMP